MKRLLPANDLPIDWLTVRPVAHRGLHDSSSNVVENTASAVQAAIAAGYAIELDLQLAADGEAVIHHDDELGRVTDARGIIRELSSAELKLVRFRSGSDRILTIAELCDLVAGRATLVLELKSHFDHDARLPLRVLSILRSYRGAAAVMSFDPFQVEVVRDAAPFLPRGLVGQRPRRSHQMPGTERAVGRPRRWFSRLMAAQPHFVAYAAQDLPAVGPFLARSLLGTPVLAWTIRSMHDWRRARRWADQMIFENFRP